MQQLLNIKFEFQMTKGLLLLALIGLSMASQGSLQVTPVVPTLFTSSQYTLSYYTVFPLPADAHFLLDFSQTYIQIPDAIMNTTATIQNQPVTGSTAVCAAMKCTLKLNNAMVAFNTLTINFGLLTNPYFLHKQTISTQVVFNGTYTEYLFWDIVASTYTPLSMTLNSMSQSNYGVGNTNVTYTFNLSIPMTPTNPQLSFTVPSQVGLGSLSTSLSFYSSIQNSSPVIFNNFVMFSITTSASNSPGIIYLTVGGLINPQSIGTSQSFAITLQLSSKPSGGSCTGCTVAVINSNVLAKSTVPGNIETISFQNSDKLVGNANTISIYSKLLASIPQGGKYQITLPASVQPKLPITCVNGYGFSISTPPAKCVYDVATHTISTSNFFFSGTGNVVLRTTIFNPPDTRSAQFTFQTFDELGNMIGNSSQPTSLVALPLTLNAKVSKNAVQVDTVFKLSVNVTLGVALTQNDFIRVILPQASYVLSGITCFSASVSIPCTSTTDVVSGILTVSMAPPCSNCQVGSNLSFAIDALTNPSFISAQSEAITVQTAHPEGVVEQASLSSALSASTVSISNYARSGSKIVGSAYTMSFSFSIPAYISANGGQLIIKFSRYDSYVAVIDNGGTLTYPTSLTIQDSNGVSYPNTVAYQTSEGVNVPNSIKEIVVQICGANPCSGNIVISGLNRGYYPLTTMTQTVQIATTGSDSVAATSFSVLQENVIKNNQPLAITVSNSVTTLSSSYIFKFTSNKIPIDGKITFTFSTMHVINGNCFGVENSTLFSGVLTCNVINNQTIQLLISGDIIPMMIEVIEYSITVTNVTNPATIQPLTYTINTLFNSVIGQTFSTTYSIQNPLPLSLTYTRSNSTYAQAAILNLTLTTSHPTFDQIKLNVPADLMTVTSNGNYLAAINNNSFEVSQIYALSGSSIIVDIVNPASTVVTGQMKVSMFLGGYLTAQGSVSIASVLPVYLGLAASSSNRIVGDNTDVTLHLSRVHPFSAETHFVVNIASTLFDLSGATYNGNALVLPLTVPISTSTVVIGNAKNLLEIPAAPQTTGLDVYSVDASGGKVAESSFDASGLSPDTATTGLSYTFTRSNTAISGVGSLTVVYNPRFPSVASTIKITLPQNQMTMLSSSCEMQTSSLVGCQVISSSSSAILVSYQGQSKTILTNVSNIQPNTNLLTVEVFNSKGELVEKSSGAVTPAIKLNELTVDGSTTNTEVASNTILTLRITSHSSIASTSKIVINFPLQIYTKINALSTSPCSYVVMGSTYSGCQMAVDNNGWITGMNLTTLGSSTIPANSTITVTMQVTNAWTNKVFGGNQFVFYVESVDNSFLSHGVLAVNTINGASSFTTAQISGLQVGQTSILASQSNNVTVTFMMPVPIAVGTVIAVNIPKSSFTMNLASIQSSAVPSSSSENANYYQLKFTANCDQTPPLCKKANSSYSFSVMVNNNAFLEINRQPLSVQFSKGADLVSGIAEKVIPAHTAQSIGAPSITRSNKNANQMTNVTVQFTHTGVSAFTMVIEPLVTPSGDVALLSNIQAAVLGQTQLSHALAQGSIQVNITGQNGGSTTIILEGTNSFLIPATSQHYTMTIRDTNYIYFKSTVTPSDQLVPYNTGVSLERMVTTVGISSAIYLNGVFPSTVPQMSVGFNGNTFSLSGSSFNVSLGNITNPQNVADVTKVPILIKNADLIAFEGSLGYTPQLTPQILTAFGNISVPGSLNVSETVNITVKLSNYSISTLELTLPPFFSTLGQCCIDSSCVQTNIASCGMTAGTNNKINLVLTSSQMVTTLIFTVTAINYEASFANSQVQIYSGLPSAQFSTTMSTVIHSLPIVSTLTLGSWMVNAVNTYTLTIQPMTQNGFVAIALPTFIISQLSSGQNAVHQLTIDGSVSNIGLTVTSPNLKIPVTQATTNITLTLTSITNPNDNQPFTFNIEQASDSSLTKIYGRKNYNVKMNKFDPITVISAKRNATKVGIAVDLTINITTPSYNGAMIINFPTSQVYTQTNCSITVNGQIKTCSVINSTAIETTNVMGNGVYIIKGLMNQLSFSSVSQFDKIQVRIGSPYTRAATVPGTSTYITPQLTLGAITMNAVTSSSLILLSSTNLVYNFTIENIVNIDGFIIQYDPYFYYIPSSFSCKINGQVVSCNSINSNSIFISAPTLTLHDVQLQIDGLINYIKPANWTIRSVKKLGSNPVSYSDVDVYYSSSPGVGAMSASSMGVRVMFPNNYVQNQVQVKIIIDSTFNNIPTSSFKLNMSIPQGNCQANDQSFQPQLTLTCTFTAAVDASLSITLFDSSYSTIALAASSKTIPILAAPTGGCSNQMCDSCSNYNGQEYCFACREGQYSSGGHCVENCPGGSFPYQSSGICQQCYPSCGTCFGYTKNECLSCNNIALVVNSGTCDSSCPVGSFAYLGFCVTKQECTSVEGCRICSGSNFCYQCLPDYSGQPVCTYQSPLPPTLMIYILAPFALFALITVIIAAAKCGGADSTLSQVIFSFSFLELIAWILMVPIMENIFSSMLLLAFIALRIIISIVAYEVYYRQNLGELSQKLLEVEEESNKESQKTEKKEEDSKIDNWKTKLARFTAHFNGPDSYELLRSRIAEPILSVNHHIAVHILFMVNRWIVGVLMIYMLTVATFGDSLLMPIAVMVCGGVVSVSRLGMWDKLRSCFNRCRSS